MTSTLSRNFLCFLCSVTLVFSVFASPHAHAQTTSRAALLAQIEQLVELIATLQAQLEARRAATTSTCEYTWTTNYKIGDETPGVLKLQQYLNRDTRTQVSQSGVGSPGNETNYYGFKTAAAVSRFQELHASAILVPENLTRGTGYFGAGTRAKLNSLCAVRVTNTGGDTTQTPSGSEESESERESDRDSSSRGDDSSADTSVSDGANDSGTTEGTEEAEGVATEEVSDAETENETGKGEDEVPVSSPEEVEIVTESSVDSVTYQTSGKKLLRGRYLNLVGGYRFPLAKIDGKNTRWSANLIDKLPGDDRWITNHHAGYVLELVEPSALGTGDPDSWPEMSVGRKVKPLADIEKISPSGVFWLDSDTVLTSGRKSYRSGFEPTWIASADLNTGTETQYQVYADSNEKNDNFHLLQALGSGFMRITDSEWSDTYANGNEFLLGRGGYDVLGSPLGPALGLWDIGASNAKFLLDFPSSHPERRDSYYVYPSLDPNSYDKAQLPMWKDPDSTDGFWQAGDVGGLAFINHPEVAGIIATHNHARGVLDYRAQGDGGSGSFFLVDDPEVFYGGDPNAGRNRGDHKSEIGNAAYPDGVHARVGLVYNPDDIARVAAGEIEPWEVPSTRFEWPRDTLPWVDNGRRATRLGGVYWDNDREYLWVVIVNNGGGRYLAAYEIIPDDSRPEEPVRIPTDLESFLDN